MNILYHHRTRGVGVEAVHIMGIVKALRNMGHRVDILSPPGVNVEGGLNEISKNEVEKSKGIIDRIIQKDYFRVSFEIKEHLYNFYVFWKLHQLHKKTPIELIYERYALNCYAGVIFANKYQIPIILEVNDATGIERVRKHIFEKLASIIEIKIFNAADYLFTISSYFKDEIAKKGIKAAKIGINANAVDETVFDPSLYNNIVRRSLNINDKVVIGYVGQFVHWHGLQHLLKIVPEIIARYPFVHFLFVGEGKTFDENKKFIEAKGLNDFVSFTGRVKHDEVPCYLKAIDIGIIPHSNFYGSPMKLFEYMAMMCIPVAPRFKPMEDVITDGVNGLLFEPRNTESMKEKIFLLLKNGEKMKAIRENARDTILKRHLWKNNAESVILVYKSILAAQCLQ